MDGHKGHEDYGDLLGTKNPKDTINQIILSAALGVSAFLGFCALRPRWSGLYAARKKQKDEASALPELPTTFFGWIIPLWKITDQQVLASAGLDAYVFLAFFKFAIRYLTITLFFSLVVIKPVHDAYPEETKKNHRKNETESSTQPDLYRRSFQIRFLQDRAPYFPDKFETDYLWMYLVFAYFFSIVALRMIATTTRRIIEVRQEYLGSKTTITDRTIRLSGIPPELRSEEKIKEFMEDLDIGRVEGVMLCRKWKDLDDAMVERSSILRSLEEAWTVYMGHRRIERSSETLPIAQPSPPGPLIDGGDDEDEQREGNNLLGNDESQHPAPYARTRPKLKLRYGTLKLKSREVDAIDYYEEKLKNMDEKILELRKKEFEPTPLAFVTMDTVAACQMAAQAVLDPSPNHLLANQSPAPFDVIWPNTYLSRNSRMVRAWSITAIILILTIFWSLILFPVATALNTAAIDRVLPGFADWLEAHPAIQPLVRTQLATLIVSLLNVLVPYLYMYLAYNQGMTSQADVELSIVSKNFFFTFFNFFIIFTILGTGSNFLQEVGDSLKDTTRIAWALARSLQGLLGFYTNFIILQGLGLFPLRLLEIGSVALYPIGRIGAKTPRDYAELVQPPVFSYGFYVPQTLLIFIICIVYSVLRDSWKVLLSGLIYFLIGGFVYKYQLLYAMDNRQHTTGGCWVMICDRTIIGLLLFQLTVGGQLALKRAPVRGALLVPLIIGTVWFAYVYRRSYAPLMKFIALKSVRRAEQNDFGRDSYHDENQEEEEVPEDMARWRYDSETRPGPNVDESKETGLRFINPSLIAPVWIADRGVRQRYRDRAEGDEERDEDGEA